MIKMDKHKLNNIFEEFFSIKNNEKVFFQFNVDFKNLKIILELDSKIYIIFLNNCVDVLELIEEEDLNHFNIKKFELDESLNIHLLSGRIFKVDFKSLKLNSYEKTDFSDNFFDLINFKVRILDEKNISILENKMEFELIKSLYVDDFKKYKKKSFSPEFLKYLIQLSFSKIKLNKLQVIFLNLKFHEKKALLKYTDNHNLLVIVSLFLIIGFFSIIVLSSKFLLYLFFLLCILFTVIFFIK